MLRTLRIWTFGAIFGVALTFEVLWSEATRTLAREYEDHKQGGRW